MRHLVTLLTAFWLLAGPAWAESPAFVAGFEDLPLMPGLTGQDEGGMVFDSPAGRIVEATAGGLLSRRQVSAFYAQTLPELGWTAKGPETYQRDREVLRLDYTERRPQGIVVRFSLSPQ